MPPSVQVQVEKLTEYTGHKGSIFGMAVDEQERTLFTSGDDGIVVAWDLHSREDQGQGVIRVNRAVYALLKIPDQPLLVAGASDGTVYFVDLDTFSIRHSYRMTTDAVYDLHFEPLTNQVWILQGNGFLGRVDLARWQTVSHQRLTEENLRRALPLHPGGPLAIGTSDHRILIMDTQTHKVIHQWRAHDQSVFALATSPDQGPYLLSGGRDAHIRVWNKEAPYREVVHIPAHLYTVNDLRFSPDGKFFVSASRDKHIKVWDAYSFELLKVIDHERNEGHLHSVNKIRWLKTDYSLISCSDDRRIIRWRLHFSD